MKKKCPSTSIDIVFRAIIMPSLSLALAATPGCENVAGLEKKNLPAVDASPSDIATEQADTDDGEDMEIAACEVSCHDGEECVDGQCRCGGTGPDCLGTEENYCCGTSCVDTKHDTNNCGGCGVTCVAYEICMNGTCMCEASMSVCAPGTLCCWNGCLAAEECPPECEPGTMDCDDNPINGCETEVNDVTRCGSCTEGCSNEHGTTTCVDAVCVPTCTWPWGDCNGNPRDGCETDTFGSDSHCGTCGSACDAGEHCINGLCYCGGSSGPDCAGTSLDFCCGSECVNLETNTNHCGSCGHACTNDHGSTSCVDGSCRFTCDDGYTNCDGNADNGCEAALGTAEHCLFCGDSCVDDDPCTEDTCDPVTHCGHRIMADGEVCGHTCLGLEWHSQRCLGTRCLDDVLEANCDDGNECTEDSCWPEGGCSNVALRDGTPCGGTCEGLTWSYMTCQAGACSGSVVNEICSDGEGCTTDACSGPVGCLYVPVEDGTVCGDRFCSGLELRVASCSGGLCTGSSLVENCDRGIPCWTFECLPTGCLLHTTSADCDRDGVCECPPQCCCCATECCHCGSCGYP